ncbi:TonB-dependent receptor domain-containing protein [Croceibacterium xixiisoli]|uniref:TonB-dependent receptor domain-containing protein n=1 Tax=Croceibacterium xixiisoli TaxID=1476466 RepID=UPI002E252213
MAGCEAERLEESAPSLANTNALPRYVDSWGADLTNSSRISTGLGLISADYGASYLREDAGPVDGWVTGGAIPPGREGSRREVSLFGQLSYEPVSWLRLDGGLRYQSYDLDDKQTGTTYHTEIFSRSEDAVSFSLGGALMPLDGLQIFGSYKQAARLPSLMEATTGFFMIANPDLHKEEARNWEAGVNYLHNGLLGSDDQLGLKLTGFDNDINGYISRRYISQYFAMQMFNIDRAKFRGLEGSLSYSKGGFKLDAGATYYDHVEFCRTAGNCVESSLASDYGTNYIPPRWAANLSVSQTFFDDRAMLGARATYMGKRIVGAEVPHSGYMPLITAVTWQPYVVVDMTGSFRVSDGLSIDWSVDNITDRYYNEAMSLAYVPAPGRTFRIGFTGTFGSGEGGTAHAMWPAKWFASDGETTDWTGPYVGGSIGYGVGKTRGGVTDLAGTPTDLVNNSRIDQTMRNFIGGLHAGYNYQLPSNVVLGIEADISSGDLASTSSVGLTGDQQNIPYLQSNGALESDTEYKWDRMLTLRGRLGYAVGQTLFYGTAGLAWLTETQTRNQYRSWPTNNEEQMGVGQAVEHLFFEKDRQQRAGAVFGTGMERSLGRNWSMRVDYGYARFDRKDFTFKDARAGIVLDHGYYEVVGYQQVPAQIIDFGDGTFSKSLPMRRRSTNGAKSPDRRTSSTADATTPMPICTPCVWASAIVSEHGTRRTCYD